MVQYDRLNMVFAFSTLNTRSCVWLFETKRPACSWWWLKHMRTLLQHPRGFATRRTLDSVALSLDHFLQRSRVLSLYRTILRRTRAIPDTAAKAETRQFARAEFERHRHVTDIAHIRYLLSTGKTEWERTEKFLGVG